MRVDCIIIGYCRICQHIPKTRSLIRVPTFNISANLICRGTDISKYFRESAELQDNESRQYKRTMVVLIRPDCAGVEADLGLSLSIYPEGTSSQAAGDWIHLVLFFRHVTKEIILATSCLL